uniref:histone acetyltransferase n=1 Tax=Grammatophora oceanica TaxID=210454 RepID=A0A7S1UQR6_9STRA|mmetsp:Transcript_17890/g.26517  ORF Transcript_17890/g.26517 Transcript_17890/m.26517 type:complete len:1400 (+) Transcript_17890:53-4252(+)|eukprot:CAMPEP_0194037630 /NCGR_PEP_ID=MMETSP0009_2-20130614/9971_1 /TAXON_ID=210454 /ORGANISM="Grammatophora oceanica, Strain CCMP 410" /LENGTH=1399 /DNA_ID=CAMNT_0038679873 /DNA_START=36 /DNA_END=4235 /DNA_ORIENTATION=+
MTVGTPTSLSDAPSSLDASDLGTTSKPDSTFCEEDTVPSKIDDDDSSENDASGSPSRVGSKKRRRSSAAGTGPTVLSQQSSGSSCAQYISSGGEDDDDDDGTGQEDCDNEVDSKPSATPTMELEIVPPLPNPLHLSKKLLSTHVHALRLEADLAPMRTIVARLLTNPTHNRRGIFNKPVDHVALNLVDYTKIVTRPMDLGTIKSKLHAVAYHSRAEVANDIRLTFTNAMSYNPPDNAVHICAKHLMKQFDEWYEVMRATVCSPLDEPGTPLPVKRTTGAALTISPWLTPRNIVPATASPVAGLRSSSKSKPTVAAPPYAPSITAPLLAPRLSDAGMDETSSSHADATTSTPKISDPVGQPQEDLKSPPVSGVDAPKKPGKKMHVHANWKDPGPMDCEKAMKRAMNIATKHAKHTCGSCLGRQCDMCHQGCLQHEPVLLICTGSNCSGTKIRKGATYYIAKDGSRQFCQRCYANLQAVLPHTSDQLETMGTAVRYKRDLLKRRNDEDVPERWLTCAKCSKGVHKVCALFNPYTDSAENWHCPSCVSGLESNEVEIKPSDEMDAENENELYSFVSGSDFPVKLSDVQFTGAREPQLRADDLPETPLSRFIQSKIRDCMKVSEVPNAHRTVSVRMISTTDKSFKVPEVVRNHFRMQQEEDRSQGVLPPSMVHYRSKAMMLFQKIDGFDVCIFCMYVQEYDGEDDEFDEGSKQAIQRKRVYIAYLDSVEHFRPRVCRTKVYHEMMVSYLATARARGFENAYIWACPPSRGNSFVFWNHPSSQRTPSKERLVAWYHGALSRAVSVGAVTDVTSLYETDFHEFMTSQEDAAVTLIPSKQQQGVLDGRLICPPLLDGDFWIEEAVRAHAANIARFMRSRSSLKIDEDKSSFEIDPLDVGCPATEIATLLRDRIIPHPSALPFRKPVNAAALKLKDYHKVIKKPMDLGTVYSSCLLGEYARLQDFVADVELVFSNAMRYNPKGNPVHDEAVALRKVFFDELEQGVISRWRVNGQTQHGDGWKRFGETSMSLDARIKVEEPVKTAVALPMAAMAGCSDEAKTQMIASVVNVVPNDSSPAPSPTPDGEKQTLSQPPQEAQPEQSVAMAPSEGKRLPKRSIKRTSSKQAVFQSSGRKPISLHSPTTIRRTSSFLSRSNSQGQIQPQAKRKLKLLTGGPEAIEHRMVGDDVWLLEKKPVLPIKAAKKLNGKRRKSTPDAEEEQPAPKRRRQSWLGEEVGATIRNMRTGFFSCSLVPKAEMSDDEQMKAGEFDKYIASFVSSGVEDDSVPSSIADQRHALLEFSQFRNLEFDTLRRAKYSTSVLLYHLHNSNAPGLIPCCTKCNHTIQDVRWHRVRATRDGRLPPTLRRRLPVPLEPRKEEELCGSCYHHTTPSKALEDFIPLPVSFKTYSA